MTIVTSTALDDAMLSGAFTVQPIEEAALRRGLVLEALDTLVAKMNADGLLSDHFFELDRRIKDPSCPVPWDGIEDLCWQGFRTQSKSISQSSERERTGRSPWQIRYINAEANECPQLLTHGPIP